MVHILPEKVCLAVAMVTDFLQEMEGMRYLAANSTTLMITDTGSSYQGLCNSQQTEHEIVVCHFCHSRPNWQEFYYF